MHKAETRDGEEIRLLRETRVPLWRVPGDLNSIDTNLLANGMGSDDNTSFVRCQRGGVGRKEIDIKYLE